MAARIMSLLERYLNAKKEGLREGYDIKTIHEDNYEHYYILFKAKAGVYRDQYHIVELNTEWGNDADRVRYPIHAPHMKFLTSVYHTNISTGGSICLDILKDRDAWSPMYDFNTIIVSILLLFEEPNNASPFNSDASRSYMDCEKKFRELKKEGMSVGELDQLRDECFHQFKVIADKYASKNKLSEYAKYFPQLETGQQDLSEIKTLENILNGYKDAKKKKKEDDEEIKKLKIGTIQKAEGETKTSICTHVVDATSENKDCKDNKDNKDNNAEAQQVETKKEEQEPKRNARWAKYQKKPM